jgi:hypothetical protein
MHRHAFTRRDIHTVMLSWAMQALRTFLNRHEHFADSQAGHGASVQRIGGFGWHADPRSRGHGSGSVHLGLWFQVWEDQRPVAPEGEHQGIGETTRSCNDVLNMSIPVRLEEIRHLPIPQTGALTLPTPPTDTLANIERSWRPRKNVWDQKESGGT